VNKLEHAQLVFVIFGAFTSRKIGLGSNNEKEGGVTTVNYL
jgi:hypothetical protein